MSLNNELIITIVPTFVENGKPLDMEKVKKITGSNKFHPRPLKIKLELDIDLEKMEQVTGNDRQQTFMSNLKQITSNDLYYSRLDKERGVYSYSPEEKLEKIRELMKNERPLYKTLESVPFLAKLKKILSNDISYSRDVNKRLKQTTYSPVEKLEKIRELINETRGCKY